MLITEMRLPIQHLISAAGSSNGVWIGHGHSLTRFAVAGGKPALSVGLSAVPIDIAHTNEHLWVALDDGHLLALDPSDGTERLRITGVGRDLRACGRNELLYVQDRVSHELFVIDSVGTRRNVARGVTSFAAGAAGAYWTTDEGQILLNGESFQSPPSEVWRSGAMTVCSNAVWLSVDDGLLMLNAITPEVWRFISAPEGPVSHLVCADGVVVGAGWRVFILDPSVDEDVRPIKVTLNDEALALVVAGEHIWVLESGEPLAHIVRLP